MAALPRAVLSLEVLGLAFVLFHFVADEHAVVLVATPAAPILKLFSSAQSTFPGSEDQESSIFATQTVRRCSLSSMLRAAPLPGSRSED